MEEEQIKPCPFCGSDDIRISKHTNAMKARTNQPFIYSTCCYKCGATFPNRYRKQLLIDCWNRRPKDK